MRMLMIHVDSFRSELTEKGRSKLIEEPIERIVAVEEAIVILTAVEKADEVNPTLVVHRAAQEIEKIARQLKVSTLVVHSFAHLFAELASPVIAVNMLKELASELASRGFTTHRSPFGWFNTLEIKAKGHPLSRIARTIAVD